MYDNLPKMVAAVDLGSNSFHMVVARVVDGTLDVVDRLRERVGLAEGLDENKNLGRAAQKRALACLDLFGQRLAGMESGSVRAVGTNTLRQAKNGKRFLEMAGAALGHRIEVISGAEEGRLVYLGVAHSLAEEQGRRLVIDIGGGSTEVIVGEHFEPLRVDSLYMGCVTFSRRFFPDGVLSEEHFRNAETAAGLELEPIAGTHRDLAWNEAVGSSGTVNALHRILTAAGLISNGIDRDGLTELRARLIEAGTVAKLKLPGLEADRAPVLAGGLAILRAAMNALDIDELHPSGGALREGVLYDLMGRIRREDVRERTIEQMRGRYVVDVEQSERVRETARKLFDQAAPDWDLTADPWRRRLRWAAQLHELGLAINYAGYHRHGAYLLANSTMPGFSRQEQQILAALVGAQRRKISENDFESLPDPDMEPAAKLAVLLRLAVALNRAREKSELPRIHLWVEDSEVELRFPVGWLAGRPLTRSDLEQEADYLWALGYELRFS